MLRKSKPKKKQILSDKIADSFAVEPGADVEDDTVFGSKPKTVTVDDFISDDEAEEVELSNFRKRNAAKLAELSERYAGEVISRKSIEKTSDSENEEDVENDDDTDENDMSSDINKDDAVDDEVSFQSGSGSMEEDEDSKVDQDDDEKSDVSNSEEVSDMSAQEYDSNGENDLGEFKHIKDVDQSEESSKGVSTKNQLSLWENMLEVRIHLQKCLVSANKMPLTNTFNELKRENDFVKPFNTVRSNTASLLNRLLELQALLLKQYPETASICKENTSISDKKSETDDIKSEEEITSDSDSSEKNVQIEEEKPKQRKRKLNDVSSVLDHRHTSYIKYRNSVIQKWYDKIKISSISKKNQQPAIPILNQIDYILNDKDRLIRRTQIKRSKYDIVGQKSEIDEAPVDISGREKLIQKNKVENSEEVCLDIFDDDDFYHQLLRELIEYKSSDISDPIQLSRQWIALQQMRSKLKRKVDTKATKGRRIRYTVHTKLVNFMAPQPNMEWTEESKNELFASLFGKQFEPTYEPEK